MASDTLTTYASALFEMQADLEQIYPKDIPLLAEWSGYDADYGAVNPNSDVKRVTPLDNRKIFSGSQVRIPVDFNQLQGGGWVSETGTINVPIADAVTEAHITLKRIVVPASLSVDIEEDSDSLDHAAVRVLARKMQKASDALAELVDEAMCGAGDGLLGTVSSNSGSPGLTIPLTSTDDWDKLYVGKVVDILTRSNGADPGNGLRRKIVSFVEGTSITVSTTQQASDGGSGNVTFASTEGVYTAGSYGNVLSGGLEAAAATSGTFQAVNRSTYPGYKGTDGRAGVTTTAPLSDSMLGAGIVLGQRSGVRSWDFGVGDPGAIEVFKNSKASQVRYNTPTGTIRSGFTGIVYEGTGQPIPLIPIRKHKTGGIKFLRKDSATLYGRRKGPALDDHTGSPLMRFTRALPFEFWMVDRLEWGWHRPSDILFFNNLSTS